MFILFDSKQYHIFEEDPSNTKKIQTYNALAFTCLGLYYLLYCVAHWIFAVKYWVISYTMQIVQAGGVKSKVLERNFEILYYVGLALNVFIVVVNAVAQEKDLQSLTFSDYLLVGIQIVSCILLFDACQRIFAETKKNPSTKINVKGLLIHVFSYLFYLLSVVYFMFASLMKSPRFELAEILKSGFSSLSQILICYVFWSIHNISQSEYHAAEPQLDESYEFKMTRPRISYDGDENDRFFASILVSRESADSLNPRSP